MAHKLLKPGQLTEDDKKVKSFIGLRKMVINPLITAATKMACAYRQAYSPELIPMLLTNIDKATAAVHGL